MSVAEFAEATDKSEKTVRAWIAAGLLPASRFNRSILARKWPGKQLEGP